MVQTIVTAKTEQITENITYEEFLQKYSGVHAEYIDGKVNVLMTASDRHQDLVGWLIAILRLFVETYDLGWLRPAPFNMRLPDRNYGREPDILFVIKERLDLVKSSYLDGAADLVIEIVSPESIGRDRGEKFAEYEAAGIREYWLIDPDREQAEFYQLADNDRYRLMPPDAEGRFQSIVLPNFWLQVDWFWHDPLPKVLDVAGKLGLLAL